MTRTSVCCCPHDGGILHINCQDYLNDIITVIELMKFPELNEMRLKACLQVYDEHLGKAVVPEKDREYVANLSLYSFDNHICMNVRNYLLIEFSRMMNVVREYG